MEQNSGLKYNFELDMVGDNSNSLILREVMPNSEVLEFGCAYGRMTKYLKEQLNCNVFIVEYNSEAGKVAAAYSSQAMIGSAAGDIEDYFWLSELKDKKFDYIIFADVLEHLYDPWQVLSSTKDLLKDNGRVLISIPNLGHNSIILDLLNDKFNYRDIGLLDNTHIRFFTEKSLLEMVQKSGYKVDKFINAINAVEFTEFNNSYNDVPVDVAEYLKQRKNGEVYQFVWSLCK
jgi:O-antigen biosynthesis protein